MAIPETVQRLIDGKVVDFPWTDLSEEEKAFYLSYGIAEQTALDRRMQDEFFTSAVVLEREARTEGSDDPPTR